MSVKIGDSLVVVNEKTGEEKVVLKDYMGSEDPCFIDLDTYEPIHPEGVSEVGYYVNGVCWRYKK